MSSHDLLMSKKSLDRACVLNIIYSLLEGRLEGSISQAQRKLKLILEKPQLRPQNFYCLMQAKLFNSFDFKSYF